MIRVVPFCYILNWWFSSTTSLSQGSFQSQTLPFCILYFPLTPVVIEYGSNLLLSECRPDLLHAEPCLIRAECRNEQREVGLILNFFHWSMTHSIVADLRFELVDEIQRAASLSKLTVNVSIYERTRTGPVSFDAQFHSLWYVRFA